MSVALRSRVYGLCILIAFRSKKVRPRRILLCRSSGLLFCGFGFWAGFLDIWPGKSFGDK